MLDVVLRLGEHFEAALLDFLVGHAHHRAGGVAPAHGIGPRGGVAERLHLIVSLPLEAMLFQDSHGNNRVAGGDRVGRQKLSFEVSIVIDPGGDNELLIDALAAAEKNNEIVFLRVFALAFRPGNDIVRIVEDEIVVAADQITQQGRRIGDGTDFHAKVFLLEKIFAFRGDDRRIAIEQSYFDDVFGHGLDRQQC